MLPCFNCKVVCDREDLVVLGMIFLLFSASWSLCWTCSVSSILTSPSFAAVPKIIPVFLCYAGEERSCWNTAGNCCALLLLHLCVTDLPPPPDEVQGSVGLSVSLECHINFPVPPLPQGSWHDLELWSTIQCAGAP